MSTTKFNTTNKFWQQCQDAVVRIEREMHDNTFALSVRGVGKG